MDQGHSSCLVHFRTDRRGHVFHVFILPLYLQGPKYLAWFESLPPSFIFIVIWLCGPGWP